MSAPAEPSTGPLFAPPAAPRPRVIAIGRGNSPVARIRKIVDTDNPT